MPAIKTNISSAGIVYVEAKQGIQPDGLAGYAHGSGREARPEPAPVGKQRGH